MSFLTTLWKKTNGSSADYYTSPKSRYLAKSVNSSSSDLKADLHGMPYSFSFYTCSRGIYVALSSNVTKRCITAWQKARDSMHLFLSICFSTKHCEQRVILVSKWKNSHGALCLVHTLNSLIGVDLDMRSISPQLAYISRPEFAVIYLSIYLRLRHDFFYF